MSKDNFASEFDDTYQQLPLENFMESQGSLPHSAQNQPANANNKSTNISSNSSAQSSFTSAASTTASSENLSAANNALQDKSSSNSAKQGNTNFSKQEPKPQSKLHSSAQSKGIYVARSNEEIAAELAKENQGKDKTNANGSSNSDSIASQTYDDYVNEKLADARLRQHQEENAANTDSNSPANINSQNSQTMEAEPDSQGENTTFLLSSEHKSPVYPSKPFLRSTPPKENTAKILAKEDDGQANTYKPYYDTLYQQSDSYYLQPESENSFTAKTAAEFESYNEASQTDTINSSTNEEAAGKARAEKASSKAFSTQPLATRTGRAARYAGLDLADHFYNSKLKQSLNNTRNKHPQLMERPLTISDSDASALIDKIKSVPSYRVSQIANELNSEEVKFVFHAILILPPEDSSTYNSLQQIAVIRASWSLFTIGWSTLQRNFPNRKIQNTLELEYQTLVTDPSRAEVRPSYMHRAIGDVVNLAKSDAAFVNDIVRNLNQSYNLSPEEGLEAFIEEYQLLVENNLGGQIFGDFFRKADLPVLYKKKEILCQALPYMHPGIAAEVISRIISNRDPIAGNKLYIYRQIADIFLHKAVNHPIWQYLSRDLTRSYKSWYIKDRLLKQMEIYPAKSAFIDTYTEYIEDLAMITSDIMAIRFSNFILLDDKKRGDSLIYYADSAVKDLLLRGFEEKDLANPSLAKINSARAIKNKERSGIVLLEILPPALEYSRRFMDLALGKSRKGERNIFTAWLKD